MRIAPSSAGAAVTSINELAYQQNLLARFGDRPVPIEMPADIADLLFAASPRRAHDFALRLHERACEDGALGRADFWQQVVEELSSAE